MASVCTYELARLSDAESIANLSRWLIEAGLQPTWTSARVTWHIRHPESVVLLARESGRRLIGFAIMQFGESSAHLNLLGVLPARQRHGIGRHLLRWLETTAMDAGIFLVKLEVRATNMKARKFYEALGYRELDVVSGYYEGQEDAIRMRRDLGVLVR
jgi:ribosomal-protein-alanine acetyltransferase